MKRFDDKFDTARPYIASFIILRRGREVAMIMRKNTGWMDGFYGCPAGKVEYGETYAKAAIREAKEEVGVEILEQDIRFAHATHRHGEDEEVFMDWVDVYFEAEKWVGEPHNAESEKSERLDWLDLDNLPENIVPPQRAALEQIAKGEKYSEYGWSSDER